MKATKSILKHLKIARDNLANQNNKCEYICEALGWPDRGTENMMLSGSLWKIMVWIRVEHGLIKICET